MAGQHAEVKIKYHGKRQECDSSDFKLDIVDAKKSYLSNSNPFRHWFQENAQKNRWCSM